MRYCLLAFIVLFTGFAAPTAADARPRHQRSAQAPDGAPSLEAKRTKVRQRIRALRAWRLTEALDLDEATAARLFPILNRYDEKLAAVLKDGARLRRELRALIKAQSASASATNALVDRMVKQQREQWTLEERRFGEVRAVLTPMQAAQLLVVLPQIDRSIHREISQAMRGGSRRTPKATGSDPNTVKNPFRGANPGPKTRPERKQPKDDGIISPF
jgi:Spy/CpxP family protein refolding chaperone